MARPTYWNEDVKRLIDAADRAYEQGKVDVPLDYVDAHINECKDPDKAYQQIQGLYEARAMRGW